MQGDERQRPRARPGHAATPSSRSAAGTRTPSPCSAPGRASALIALGLLMAVYVVAKLTPPDATDLRDPGRDPRGDPRPTTGTCCSATRSCSPCTRSRAWRASWRAARSALGGAPQRVLEVGPREGRPACDRLRRLRHALLARHAGLHHRRHRRLDRDPARHRARAR